MMKAIDCHGEKDSYEYNIYIYISKICNHSEQVALHAPATLISLRRTRLAVKQCSKMRGGTRKNGTTMLHFLFLTSSSLQNLGSNLPWSNFRSTSRMKRMELEGNVIFLHPYICNIYITKNIIKPYIKHYKNE